MGRRAKQSQSLGFDPELAELSPEARWREWMNRIEAVLFAAPQPLERPALARIVGRDASIDLLTDDIRAELKGKPYDADCNSAHDLLHFAPGAPFTYVTTTAFLSHFGLESLRGCLTSRR